MLPPTIVCAACHRASEGHDRNGNCVALRRDYQPYDYSLRQSPPQAQAQRHTTWRKPR